MELENWNEIKKDGKTVEYVSDLLAKLITVCKTDIDNLENR